MISHSHHDAIFTAGLADDCERCEELAKHPFEMLDDDNLIGLIRRTEEWRVDDVLPRSVNERIAMTIIEQALVWHEQLNRLTIYALETEPLLSGEALLDALAKGRRDAVRNLSAEQIDWIEERL